MTDFLTFATATAAALAAKIHDPWPGSAWVWLCSGHCCWAEPLVRMVAGRMCWVLDW